MTRVLIIDDSPTETYKMEAILKKRGYDVVNVGNGVEGVEAAKKHAPDVILMDVVMPGLNGFQATRQLGQMKETAHIPIIIITTKDQQTDRLWGKRQGAKGYLVKPVGSKELIETVEQVLKGGVQF